jgi:NAD(P)-dependent dehydrogenase (short-subunit alcohol dehydrogenase family)
MFDLTGRVAVVTGGNGGIGLGMARALAEAGADVALWGRNGEKNEQAVAELATSGRRASSFICDVADEDRVVEALAATIAEMGRVDTMIANAGIGIGGPITDMSLETWRRVMAVNLDGAFLCLRGAARHMIERGEGGSLIGVASTSAIHGAPANEAYSASKAGLCALVRGLAVELARHKIRCNTIMPGWTETDLTEPLQGWQKFVDTTTKRTPVRRWGTPADMGPTAVFLADPTVEFHTGDTVVVDGGYTIF